MNTTFTGDSAKTQYTTTDRLSAKRFFCFRGFMKSGTNWVGSLLNLHPQISCVGEFHWETLIGCWQRDMRQWPTLSQSHVRMAVRRNFQEMIKKSLADVADEDALVIGDRTPHTIKPIVIIDAPHITLIRDGRDVLVSRIFHLFNHPGVSRVFERFPDMRERLEKFKADPWFFRQRPEQLLANEEVVRQSMRWWKEHLQSDRTSIARHKHLRVLSLKYEDFHTNIQSNRIGMYEFLDVDPQLAVDIPDRLMPVLKQERPNAFRRKGQIGDWQNYMTDPARRWINEEAGQELIRNGYVESLNW